jgi:hypothetical protein
LNAENSGFHHYYMFPSMDKRSWFHFTEKDKWLRRGIKLATLDRFLSTVAAMRKRQIRKASSVTAPA